MIGEPASIKIVSLTGLVERLTDQRAAGRTVAFANGIFDLLHVGHLRYLTAAAAEADLLVVGINSDGSARSLKGEGRPVTPAPERAELVAGLACVDYVIVFDEPTCDGLLGTLKPEVHCKGTDYSTETVPEAATVRSYGGRVAIVGDSKRHSTRDIISTITNLP